MFSSLVKDLSNVHSRGKSYLQVCQCNREAIWQPTKARQKCRTTSSKFPAARGLFGKNHTVSKVYPPFFFLHGQSIFLLTPKPRSSMALSSIKGENTAIPGQCLRALCAKLGPARLARTARAQRCSKSAIRHSNTCSCLHKFSHDAKMGPRLPVALKEDALLVGNPVVCTHCPPTGSDLLQQAKQWQNPVTTSNCRVLAFGLP